MKLVWRRAREARGLLVAAVIAALVAVALVTGLSDYNRRAVDAGQRALVAASPAEERGLLVNGSGGRDAAEFATRDQAVRAEFASGLAGAPVSVAAARYGTGRELTGDLGQVTRPDDEPVFANLATLDDLAAHAELTSGAWPSPGANPVQVSLPERVAGTLGLSVGERIPVRDRATERRGELVLAGTWRPRDPTDAYWLLAPGVGRAVPVPAPRTGRSPSTRSTSSPPRRGRCRRPGWPNRTSRASTPPICPPCGKPSPRRPRPCPRPLSSAVPGRR